MGIGTNIKKLRVNTTKYTQQDVADRLEIDRITYANWEKESTCIKSQYIPVIAELLQVDIKKLFEDENKISIVTTIKTKDSSTGSGITINISDKESAEKITEQIEKLIKALDK